jgi:hypothetical protein
VYERCLNEAELILSARQEPMVPVRQVWEEIVKRSKTKGFEVASLSDFSAMLEGDNRFQLVPAQIKIHDEDDVVPDVDMEDSDMEHLGFFSEDSVKLRSRRIVETVINEDDEEVGSIRRRAFVGQTGTSRNITVNAKPVVTSKSIPKKAGKKKKSQKGSTSVHRTKPLKTRKLKVHKRGKK